MLSLQIQAVKGVTVVYATDGRILYFMLFKVRKTSGSSDFSIVGKS